MNTNIAVIGAEGFLGSALLRGLAAHDIPAMGISRRRIRALQSKRIERSLPETAEYYAAILDQVGTVVWFAGSTTPGSSACDASMELSGNLKPLLEFLKAWQGANDRPLLYVSTGGAMYGDLPDGAATEQSPIHAKSYYAAGKIAAEQFIGACCRQFGSRATILRPSNIYGHGQYYRPGFGIVPTAFHSIVHGEPFTVWGDPTRTIRDYLAIDDFVALCLGIVSDPWPLGMRIFHASSGIGTSVTELLAIIEATTGRKIALERRPSRSLDVSRIVLENRQACQAFDWQPRVTLPDGLAKAWLWFRTAGT